MPRPIDFKAIRRMITPRRVFELLGAHVQQSFAGEATTRCPAMCVVSLRGREATVNDEIVYCHRCKESFDAVAIWSIRMRMSAYNAAVDLCNRLALEVPYNIQRHASN